MRYKKSVTLFTINTTIRYTSILLLLLLSMAPAAALRSGWHMGAGIGASDYKGVDVDAQLAKSNFSGKTELADEGVTWRLFVGYQTPYAVGFEIEYLNLKKRTGGSVITVPLIDVTETESDTDGLAFSARLAWSVRHAPRNSLIASAGTYLWHARTSTVSLAGGTSATLQLDDYGAARFYDIAFERRVTRRAALRLAWRSLKIEDDATEAITFSVIRLMGVK